MSERENEVFRHDPTHERTIRMAPGLAAIPERLLRSQAEGRILFLVGAGASMQAPSNLPSFKKLTLDVYNELDRPAYDVLSLLNCTTERAKEKVKEKVQKLQPKQQAEIRRFQRGEFDVALGMLERRIDGETELTSKVRDTVVALLRKDRAKPSRLHECLMTLADRGGSVAIVTTNFDLLLEDAVATTSSRVESYTLGGIPRPSRSKKFEGVFHIHGMIDEGKGRLSDLVVTDRDFGDFYLRRRIVPDFIYDAARLYHLVLVGYQANDPPMNYLLNAVAADGTRFSDMKERYAFISGGDAVVMEDWIGRGITPIVYPESPGHPALLKTLEEWSRLSSEKSRPKDIESRLIEISQIPKEDSTDADRDLFDFLIRRGSALEIEQHSQEISKSGAGLGWLDAILEAEDGR